ncbi:hypothetical protein EVAR_27528_1 [Eumeta japonica]|uniref:Reverse transcriptase domain-containing protein n=1 Tax=Eumeta variegata TaxID=151549 RepID=A0A4C1W440_EUMVA|nr:hypothetical protein EVAR_27528_1 [Eumeta japonica]
MNSCLYDLKEYEYELRIDELSVKCLLYGLQEMVNKMDDSVKKRDMKVNVGKTKVMVFEITQGVKVGQVKESVYLGSLFTNDAKHDRDIERRVNAENKATPPSSQSGNSQHSNDSSRVANIHDGYHLHANGWYARLPLKKPKQNTPLQSHIACD